MCSLIQISAYGVRSFNIYIVQLPKRSICTYFHTNSPEGNSLELTVQFKWHFTIILFGTSNIFTVFIMSRRLQFKLINSIRCIGDADEYLYFTCSNLTCMNCTFQEAAKRLCYTNRSQTIPLNSIESCISSLWCSFK